MKKYAAPGDSGQEEPSDESVEYSRVLGFNVYKWEITRQLSFPLPLWLGFTVTLFRSHESVRSAPLPRRFDGELDRGEACHGRLLIS